MAYPWENSFPEVAMLLFAARRVNHPPGQPWWVSSLVELAGIAIACAIFCGIGWALKKLKQKMGPPAPLPRKEAPFDVGEGRRGSRNVV